MSLLAEGLETGPLSSMSTAGAVQRYLRIPAERVEAVRKMLRQAEHHTPGELALLLRASMATRSLLEASRATVEVAATHPRYAFSPQVRGAVDHAAA